MSAFLGPIHYWLYNKIKLQQEFVDQVVSYGEQRLGLDNLGSRLNDKYGEFDVRPLEDIINTSNIHGWLQERVQMVENKLAVAVTEILGKDANALIELEKLFEQTGVNFSKEVEEDNEAHSLGDVYNELSNLLLDGMPCDHANSVEEKSDGEIIIIRNVCVHQEYWDAIGGDVRNYYKLRDAFIKGYLKKRNLEYVKIDEETSSIKGEI